MLVKLQSSTNTRLVDIMHCWEHGISVQQGKSCYWSALRWELVRSTNEDINSLSSAWRISLQMLSFTITGWENRIVSLLISWLSLWRNGRKLEFSSKKKHKVQIKIPSTSFKIQTSSQLQQTNIQPTRNHLEHTTESDNYLKVGKHLNWGWGDLSKYCFEESLSLVYVCILYKK